MNDSIFSVYDAAAGAYLHPFFAPTVEFALRNFRQAVNTPDHQFAKFPEDYTLFLIGRFDQSTGQLTPLEPTSLGVALTFVDRTQLDFVSPVVDDNQDGE